MIAPADIVALVAGSAAGLILAVVGGGGSILATPLLLYVVGVASPQVAIGTGAMAVGANALFNLLGHAREGHVKWPCAVVFAGAGIAGALAGASLGRKLDGEKLLALFALVMFAVAIAMVRSPQFAQGNLDVRITPAIAVRLLGLGAVTGFFSGFFGIGGGFLIVPGLVYGSGMAMIHAVGSSLLSVGAFGLATGASYAGAGLVDWRVAAFFLAGGLGGGAAGLLVAHRLAPHRVLMTRILAAMIVLAGVYVLYRAWLSGF